MGDAQAHELFLRSRCPGSVDCPCEGAEHVYVRSRSRTATHPRWASASSAMAEPVVTGTRSLVSSRTVTSSSTVTKRVTSTLDGSVSPTRKLSNLSDHSDYTTYTSDQEFEQFIKQPKTDYTYARSASYNVISPQQVTPPNMSRRCLRSGSSRTSIEWRDSTHVWDSRSSQQLVNSRLAATADGDHQLTHGLDVDSGDEDWPLNNNVSTKNAVSTTVSGRTLVRTVWWRLLTMILWPVAAVRAAAAPASAPAPVPGRLQYRRWTQQQTAGRLGAQPAPRRSVTRRVSDGAWWVVTSVTTVLTTLLWWSQLPAAICLVGSALQSLRRSSAAAASATCAAVSGAATAISAAVLGAGASTGGSVLGAATSTGAAVGGAATSTGAAVLGAATSTGAAVLGAATSTGDAVLGAATSTGAAVLGAVRAVGAAVGGVATSTGAAVLGVAGAVGGAVTGAAGNVSGAVTSMATAAKQAVWSGSQRTGRQRLCLCLMLPLLLLLLLPLLLLLWRLLGQGEQPSPLAAGWTALGNTAAHVVDTTAASAYAVYGYLSLLGSSALVAAPPPAPLEKPPPAPAPASALAPDAVTALQHQLQLMEARLAGLQAELKTERRPAPLLWESERRQRRLASRLHGPLATAAARLTQAEARLHLLSQQAGARQAEAAAAADRLSSLQSEFNDLHRTLLLVQDGLSQVRSCCNNTAADWSALLSGRLRDLEQQLDSRLQVYTASIRQELVSEAGAAASVIPGSGVSRDEALAIARQTLALYDADKTGKFDFALESAGGSIVNTRCTESYNVKSARISVFGIPLWYPSNNPRTIVQPSVSPGECFAFRGHGYFVISLSRRIRPTEFVLEHISRSLTPGAAISSAPREFSVMGLSAPGDQEGVLLGQYVYQESGLPLQSFPVQTADAGAFSLVELRVRSNWGHPDYTCVYRFRVHGHPSQPEDS